MRLIVGVVYTCCGLVQEEKNRRKLAVFSLCEAESAVGLVKCKITESSSTYSVISSNNVFTTSLLDTAGSNVYIWYFFFIIFDFINFFAKKMQGNAFLVWKLK